MSDNLAQITAQVDELSKQAEQAVAKLTELSEFDDIRVNYLGKKGLLTAILKTLGKASADERPLIGQVVNKAKATLQNLLNTKKDALTQAAIAAQLASETIDITLDGRGQNLGGAHPISLTRQKIENFFSKLGFDVVHGPELENEFYNFDALNIPEHHPARADHDTFYFGDGRLLRTHTSNVQIREMKKRDLPLRLIAPGRVYRCDSDLTHSPMFHQVEGLWVDEHVTFANLKSVLQQFLSDFFEQEIEMRLRPSYFPFTEPSAEVDIRLSSDSDWLEVLGCGMVHPAVLANVGIDSERYNGFAFGMGIDRFAMLRYGVQDLRAFFDNDLQFLRQF